MSPGTTTAQAAEPQRLKPCPPNRGPVILAIKGQFKLRPARSEAVSNLCGTVTGHTVLLQGVGLFRSLSNAFRFLSICALMLALWKGQEIL
jgi:hypothetical protein